MPSPCFLILFLEAPGPDPRIPTQVRHLQNISHINTEEGQGSAAIIEQASLGQRPEMYLSLSSCTCSKRTQRLWH